jgi:hypothetical protein
MITIDTAGSVAFRKLAWDSVKNVIFFGIASAVIFEIGSHVRWLGLVLFGLYTVMLVLSIVQNILSALCGVFIFIFKAITLTYGTKNLWWDLINAVQLADDGFCILYFVILYRHFFVASAATAIWTHAPCSAATL